MLTGLLRFIAEENAAHTAEALLAEFGTLGGILSASAERLSRSASASPHVVRYLGLLGQSIVETLRTEAMRTIEIRTGDDLVRYLYADMARKNAEEFRVLYLDTRRALIADEIANRGSLSEVVVHTREIVRRALDLGARHLILIHNHPSGDPSPSDADLRMTRELEQATRWFDIVVDDHIIIGRSGSVSLRRRGLI